MQIFIKTHNKTLVREIDNNSLIADINADLMNRFNVKLSSIYNEKQLATNVLSEMQTYMAVPMLCGGGNMTETNKALALAQLKMKICRKCYARNAIKATRCRKVMCGHHGDLRVKKMNK